MTATSGIEPIAGLHGRQPSAEVTKAVQVASAETGVDFSYLLAKAAVESNFDADAKARTSSATGLFQFIDSTWLAMIKEHGAEHGYGEYADAIAKGNLSSKMRKEILDLRLDAKASALMAAEYTNDNKAILERKVGGEITETDLYMAHFLGAGGASKFLNAMRDNPDGTAAELFPKAARANKPVFYKDGRPCTLAEVHARFAEKFAACVPSGPVEAPAATGYTLSAASAANRPGTLLDSLRFPELGQPSGPVGAGGPVESSAAFLASAADAGRSTAMFDSLYFAELTQSSGPAPSDPVHETQDDQNGADGYVGDWAFLRPAGSAPVVAVPPASTLPGNLTFSVQMALMALEAPGSTKETGGSLWTA